VRQAATWVVSGQIDGRRGEVGVPHLVLDVLNVNPISEGVSCVGMSDLMNSELNAGHPAPSLQCLVHSSPSEWPRFGSQA